MNKYLMIAALMMSITFNLEQNQFRKNQFLFYFDIPKAFGRNLSNNSSLNTDQEKADFVRFNYYFVNGAANGHTVTAPFSYLDYVNALVGSMSEEMAANGYDCETLPTSGTLAVGTNVITFSSGSKTIPSHFGENAGSTYDKKLLFTFGGSPYMKVELKCDPSATVTSGYFLLSHADITQGISYEAHFQKNTNTEATYVDFSTGYSSEKRVMRFSTEDGTNYNLFSVYYVSGDSNAIAVSGVANGLAKAHILHTSDINSTAGPTNIDDISGVTPDADEKAFSICLDMSTDTTSVGCGNIPDPGTMTLGGTYNFNMLSIKDMSFSSF